MTIFKQFTFDSAHYLPMVPEGHKCRAIHGHTYRLTVFVKGPLDDQTGWVADFAEIKRAVNTILEKIDHKLLNEVPGLENPTCEMVATWLWKMIIPSIPQLSKIELHETPTSGVIYEGK